ncbi:uncharacterized protein UV8b_02266 [Ustilaginoidea virens]|nr:uncharacterized protein UV8b_02266 [Ustilaginoidea virens]QUC18025.1 hypothetical protein UV8b_02266 [Ustilaginoidea virens]
MDDAKFSLPSISKLLGIADAGSTNTTTSPDSASESRAELKSPERQRQSRRTGRGSEFFDQLTSSTRRQETPFVSAYSGYSHHQHRHQPRSSPPTPPLGTDSFESRHQGNGVFAARHLFEVTPPPTEPDVSSNPHSEQSSIPQSQLAQPPETYQPHQPGAFQSSKSLDSYLDPAASPSTSSSSHAQLSGFYDHQALPQNYSQATTPVEYAAVSSTGPWQHHHYLSPMHGMSYPQSQDRYICPTCSKAFSRPSSLRIHSHSHTGEKPFRCPHAGCRKAFSVRSNMKRHERGCHSFNVDTDRPHMR